jgi:hypothetical protein
MMLVGMKVVSMRGKMNKEHISSQLRGIYAKTKRQVNLGESEFVLENLFGIENIKAMVSEQFEEVYQDFFITQKVDTSKKELFSYSDIYDFINALLKIDMNDLIIFFTQYEILEFAVSFMTLLNRAFNNWAQNKKSGFRKGTRIYLEMDSSGIHLYFKPEIKT